jgi:tetratricopeptide (TPR) repeat protein
MRLVILLIAGMSLFQLSSCRMVSKTIGRKTTLENWTNSSFRKSKYPEESYYSDYRVVDCKHRKYMEQQRMDLESQMREQLSSKIVTNIKTESISNQSQMNSGSGGGFYSQNTYQSIQNSFTTLTNITTYHDYDPLQRKLHMIIFVKKDELRRSYASSIKQQIMSAQSLANSIKGADGGRESKAYNEYMNELNSKKKKIDTDLEVLGILNKDEDGLSDDMDEINILYSTLVTDINGLLLRYSSSYVNDLVNQGNTKMLNKDYLGAIEKYNQVLVFSPSNADALANKKTCVDILVNEKSKKVDSYELAENYESALDELHSITDLDPTLYERYKTRDQDLQSKFFEKSIDEIDRLIKYENIALASTKFSKIEPYAQLDIKRYNTIKARLEDLRVKNEQKSITEAIYNKNYTTALSMINSVNRDFPFNDDVIALRNQVSYLIYKDKRKEFLRDMPTRLIFEFNFSLANRPSQFVNDNSIKIENSDYLFDDLFSFYQLGFYRKFNIKPKGTNGDNKSKFRYSQYGIRLGYLNTGSGIYDLQGDTLNFETPKLTTICGSVISRRFLMFNLGVAATQDSTGLNLKNITLGLGEIGFRIPFGPVHLTADVSTYTDFDSSYLVFARAGLSINIGANRKFTKADRENIRNQIAKMVD